MWWACDSRGVAPPTCFAHLSQAYKLQYNGAEYARLWTASLVAEVWGYRCRRATAGGGARCAESEAKRVAAPAREEGTEVRRF